MSAGDATARSRSAGATTRRSRPVPGRVEERRLRRWTTCVAEGGATRSTGACPGAGHAWLTQPSGRTSSRSTRAGAFNVTRIASGSAGVHPQRCVGWVALEREPCRAARAAWGQGGEAFEAGLRERARYGPGGSRKGALRDRRPIHLLGHHGDDERGRDREEIGDRGGTAEPGAPPLPPVRLVEPGQDVLARLGVGQQLAQAFLLDEGVEQRLILEGRSQQLLSLRVGERVGGVVRRPAVSGRRSSPLLSRDEAPAVAEQLPKALVAAEVPAVDGVHGPADLRRDLHEAEALELVPQDLAAPAVEARRGVGEEPQPLAVRGDGVGPGAAVGQREVGGVLRRSSRRAVRPCATGRPASSAGSRARAPRAGRGPRPRRTWW